MSLILIFLFLGCVDLWAESKLKPFVTDGCTLFVDGPSGAPGKWRHCCVEHDLRYWFGGDQADMDKTDLRLFTCVEKAATTTWARLIYTGVRAGHYSPIKNQYQWNWGWMTKRAKKPLSTEEILYVKTELKNLVIDEVNIEEFFKINFP